MKKESTMIILSDDIIFRKAVIHLLNVELGKFAPAQDLFMMQPDVIELVRKQVCYLLNSDELKAADWNTKEPVFQKLEQMNEKDDKSFIQTSAYLADRLFDIMCDSVEIPNGRLQILDNNGKIKEFRLREMTIAGARTEIDQCNRENYCVYYKGVVEILDRFHINSYKKTFKYVLKSKKWFICGNYDDIIKAHR